MITVERLTTQRFGDFVNLVFALADYENLDRPNATAIERLRNDAFGERPRYEAFLAMLDGMPVGYAITFETYSSFLAKPTIYLEDLFVLEGARGQGAGSALFTHVHRIGIERGCGRMEWQVLDWNQLARDFYHRHDAEWKKEWLSYRITL